MSDETYERLIQLLDQRGARYRLIDHPPEGRTEVVSRLRGHDPGLAAKCMVLMVKIGKKTTKHVLVVVPGNQRVSFAAVKDLLGATYVSVASPDVAERLAGSVAGTVLPFVLQGEMEVIADPAFRGVEEIYFNAALLDRSIALNAADYFAIANPRMAKIAADGAAV
jgi:Ala-tRNA(Pro) deacylase